MFGFYNMKYTKMKAWKNASGKEIVFGFLSVMTGVFAPRCGKGREN